LWNAIQAKDYKKAEKLQKKTVKLVEIMNFTTDVTGVQEMIKLRGLDFGGYPRKPLMTCNKEISDRMKKELEKIDLI